MKKAVIINSSPRPHGNSETLADSVLDGVKAAGNEGIKINLRELNFGYCRGCYACQSVNGCAQNDDMQIVYDAVSSADSVVLISPLYWQQINGIMKNMIDRLFAIGRELHKKRNCAFIISSSLTEDFIFEKSESYLRDSFAGVTDWNVVDFIKAGGSVESESIENIRKTFDTNVIGAWNVTQKFLPLLKKSDKPRIVNVSSGAGSYEDKDYGLKHGQFGAMGYGVSKLALNGLTVKMTRDLSKDGILVNAVCPDVTNTYGGGFGRPVSVSAKSVVWAVTLPDGDVTGGFYRDGKELPW